MPEDPIVVRPPEFKKVLEELHVVRLSDNLKSEIQARRDLEDIYHRLLQDVTSLEETIEAGNASIENAKKDAERAITQQKSTATDNSTLRQRLMLAKIAISILAAASIALVAFSWSDLSGLFSRYMSGQF